MIVINQNTTNNIVVTVTQDTDTTYNYYLFVFSSLFNADTVKFTSQDTSQYPERYNLFAVTSMTSANTTGSQVYFEYEGDYKYTIYGKTSNDLDIPQNDRLLETGFARVQGTTITNQSPNLEYDNEGYDPD